MSSLPHKTSISFRSHQFSSHRISIWARFPLLWPVPWLFSPNPPILSPSIFISYLSSISHSHSVNLTVRLKWTLTTPITRMRSNCRSFEWELNRCFPWKFSLKSCPFAAKCTVKGENEARENWLTALIRLLCTDTVCVSATVLVAGKFLVHFPWCLLSRQRVLQLGKYLMKSWMNRSFHARRKRRDEVKVHSFGWPKINR